MYRDIPANNEGEREEDEVSKTWRYGMNNWMAGSAISANDAPVKSEGHVKSLAILSGATPSVIRR